MTKNDEKIGKKFFFSYLQSYKLKIKFNFTNYVQKTNKNGEKLRKNWKKIRKKLEKIKRDVL